LTLF
jgi:hypothetical protein